MTDNIKEKIQNKIIDCIASGGQGRIVVFKPENSDKDLVVERRNDYEKKKISLNIYARQFSDDRDFLSQISLAKDFIPAQNFYLVFVYFDMVKQKVGDNFWVIPSSEAADISEKNFPEYLILQKNFAGFLIDQLEGSKYKKTKE